MTQTNAPLALSIGEAAGIGPDIALVAWRDRKALNLPAFLAVGDPVMLAARANALGIAVPIKPAMPNQAGAIFSKAFPIYAAGGQVRSIPGMPHADDGKATITVIKTAAELVIDKRCRGLVTCPIAKEHLYKSGFRFPGHTEYLADLAAKRIGTVFHPVMMLVGPQLRTVPVTIHIPLAKVRSVLTRALISTTIAIVERELKTRFAIAAPRIAVSGLNPHAGENGTMGTEEIEIIAPAIETARNAGINIVGPLPADTMFHGAARQNYDVAVCMYHDQALIPAKTLAFDDAVNVTLGLPFVRTSPDHGTAFDIAGSGNAVASSLVAAIRLADQLSRTDISD